MNSRSTPGNGFVYSSIIVAILLSIIPIPDWAQHLRPQWAALIIIYWTLTRPDVVGIATGWITGLTLDVITGSLLGQQALTLSLLAFITLNIHQRTRIFPLWQQSLIIFSLLTLEHLLNFWVTGIIGKATPGLKFWFAPMIGLLIWPWLYIVLGELQQRFRRI